MNYLVVVPIIAVFVFLRWRGAGMLTWLLVWWIGIYIFLAYGFATPIPQSVISLYMGIVTAVLFLYVTSDRQRWNEFSEPIVRFATNRRYLMPLLAVLILIPCLVAASVYFDLTAPLPPPFFARTIHPANPDSVTAFDRSINLVTLDNPYRALEQSNPEAFRRHVENGRRVYYQNCFYCHGDNLSGNGMFAHALNPIPTNLPDQISILQESFLFWRIAKGAPGLPEEAGPWESAMPAWEKFLTEEEIWDVILFLYDFSGLRPRAREEVHE